MRAAMRYVNVAKSGRQRRVDVEAVGCDGVDPGQESHVGGDVPGGGQVDLLGNNSECGSAGQKCADEGCQYVRDVPQGAVAGRLRLAVDKDRDRADLVVVLRGQVEVVAGLQTAQSLYFLVPCRLPWTRK
jgi:hypothetical protein